MVAGPLTPTTYTDKANLALDTDFLVQAHMATLENAAAVLIEDSTVVTTYLASGWAKRFALALEVVASAGKISETHAGRPPDVIARVWTVTLSDWAADKDPTVKADMLNQISARWATAAGVTDTDRA